MKNMAVISERGTITIPEPIRESAHLQPGDLIEFCPSRNQIIMKHLIVKPAAANDVMTDSVWDKFDRLTRKQLRKGQYKSYSSIEKAKLHSRRLMRKR